MAYETVADTGVSQACYDFCPENVFVTAATAIETAEQDLELGEEIGLSAEVLAILRTRFQHTLERKELLARCAAECVLQKPWKAVGAGLVCGRSSEVIDTTLDLRRDRPTYGDVTRQVTRRPEVS